jgi:hypothetical protein
MTVNPIDQHEVTLSTHDIMMLGAGLTAYLREFAKHREQDGGESHPEHEWQALRNEVGQLIWRLEEATIPPGSDWIPSDDAVRPDHP